MGCCVSAPSSPYPATEPSSSSRAITSSQPDSHSALPRPTTHTSNSIAHHGHHHHNQPPLATHINRPLRMHIWTSTDRIWTRAELDRERVAFFDTRVTGRAEIWDTLRGMLEVMWTGDNLEGSEGGLATAQLIIDAADVTIPTGDPANGAYDSLGAFYALPEHIVSDPTNTSVALPESNASSRNEEGDGAGSEEVDEELVAARREEKGKAVLDTRDLVTIRARLSEGEGNDIVMSIGKDDSVRLVNRRLLEESGLSAPKRIRLAYLGKILQENQSLTAQGWQPEHVVNALVFGEFPA